MKIHWVAIIVGAIVGTTAVHVAGTVYESRVISPPPIVWIQDCVAVDGDTIRCGKLAIGLTGFDAWETCEAGGPEATAALKRRMRGLSLRFVGREVYGRALASGTWRGKLLSKEMAPWNRDRNVPRPRCS